MLLWGSRSMRIHDMRLICFPSDILAYFACKATELYPLLSECDADRSFAWEDRKSIGGRGVPGGRWSGSTALGYYENLANMVGPIKNCFCRACQKIQVPSLLTGICRETPCRKIAEQSSVCCRDDGINE